VSESSFSFSLAEAYFASASAYEVIIMKNRNKKTDLEHRALMEAREKKNKILAMQMFLRERARRANNGGLDMNENNCLMCLSKDLCNPEIRRDCEGRFILDRGLSAYYQTEVIK
jgi:hypothetical protein